MNRLNFALDHQKNKCGFNAVMSFPATKATALHHLNSFAPRAGISYAKQRNFDRGAGGHTHVSCLSPYIRRRIITEKEVLKSVLDHHSFKDAEKFVQEVFWRTYWKGWLEMRPSVWAEYQAQLGIQCNQIATQSGLRQQWEAACLGRTGIECFDAWARELAETGYLHNHARMWFASIWIFTLELPWELGADFFLRHLLDGDPASNTLSWRWVAGLQTAGKTYLARPDNIAKYTDGRFFQSDLATTAPPRTETVTHPRLPAPQRQNYDKAAPTFVLLHEDDMDLLPLVNSFENIVGAVRVSCLEGLTPFEISSALTEFVGRLSEDADCRWFERIGAVYQASSVEDVIVRALDGAATQIVSPYAAVGPASDLIKTVRRTAHENGIAVVPVLSQYDQMCWPKATHGFFRFKEHISQFLRDLNIGP
ncbi:MAG: FAD-binding domain-containing protein [Paracoccaceae bacterium]